MSDTYSTQGSLVWLHLSDLHLCQPRTDWDIHRVVDPLIKDLKVMERDHGLLPDLIFFTGDAAFGAVPELTLEAQYAGVAAFLDRVRTAFSREVPKENLFLVPGNHDVDRNEVEAADTLLLEQCSSCGEVTKLLRTAGKSWGRYMERLAAYRRFLEDHGYGHLLTDPGRLIYALTRDINGIRIGIGGFNSAWSCGAHETKGNLWLGGDWQSGEIIRQFKEQQAAIRLALLHHPYGWFTAHEDPQLRIRFEREFHVLLHGHEHQGWVDHKADGHVRVAAGACYESSWMENGYNFVRLDPLHGKGEVWLRRWDKYGGGWVPLVVADNKTDHDGCWPLPSLTWLRPTPEPGGQGGQPVSAVDLRKVHAEIGKLLAKSAGEELRKALLTEAGQGQGSKAEDVLLPPGTPFELEAAINRLHEAAKVARAGLVERRPAQTDEFVQLSASILGWLLLLAVREDWAAAGGGLGDVELIEIPVTTEAGLEIVTARLRGHEARMNVGADLGVHGRDRLAYGDLELGLTQTDALREVKRLIWVKVMKTEPPPGGDWEARLASTLRLRHRRNEGNYYISIPGDRPGDTPHHQDMLRRLRTDLPELRFFVIGGSAGGVLLLPENDLEALISEFFVQALGKFQ